MDKIAKVGRPAGEVTKALYLRVPLDTYDKYVRAYRESKAKSMGKFLSVLIERKNKGE